MHEDMLIFTLLKTVSYSFKKNLGKPIKVFKVTSVWLIFVSSWMLNLTLHSYLKMDIFQRGNMQNGVEVLLARAGRGGCVWVGCLCSLFFRTLTHFLKITK